MSDIASLGIQVTTTGLSQAQTSLDSLAASGDKAAASTDALSVSSAKASQKVGQSWASVSDSMLLRWNKAVVNMSAAAAQSSSDAASAFKDSGNSISGVSDSMLFKWNSAVNSMRSASVSAAADAAAAFEAAQAAMGESAEAQSLRLKAVVQNSLASMQIPAVATVAATTAEPAVKDVASITAQTAAMDALNKSSNTQADMNARGAALMASEDRARQSSTVSIVAQQEALAKLVGQIDPAAAAFAKLDAQQAQLASFKAAGVLSAEDFTALTAAVEANRAAVGGAAEAVSGFTLNSSMARRELGRLGADIANGNWGRFDQTALTLANQSGLLSLAFSGIGIAITAVVAGLALVAVGFVKGQQETDAYNQSLIATGNYAGATSAQLQNLAKSLSGVGSTQHDAAGALQAVVNTGQFAGDQLQLVTTAALQMQQATGQSIQTTIKQFTDLANDPVDAIIKLNDQQHFLTTAQFDQITASEAQGNAISAVSLAMQDYAAHISDTSTKMVSDLGSVETAWNAVKNAAGSAWNAILDIGRPVSGDDKLMQLQDEANALGKQLQALRDAPALGGSGFGNLGNDARAQEISALTDKFNAAVSAYHTEEHSQSDDGAAAAAKSSADQQTQQAIAAQQRLSQFKNPTDVLNTALAKANADELAAEYGVVDPDTLARIKDEYENQVTAAQKAYDEATKAPREKKEKVNPEIAAFKTLQSQGSQLDIKNTFDTDDPALTKYDQGILKLSDDIDAYMAKNGNAAKASAFFLQQEQVLQAQLVRDEAQQADANAAYAAAIDKKNDALQMQMDAQVESVGMGTQQYQESQKITQQYTAEAAALADLAVKRQMGVDGKQGGISQEQFEFDTKSVQDGTNKAVLIIKTGYTDLTAAQQDWQNGVKQGLENVETDFGDVAKSMSSAVTGAFNDMTTALVQWADTGTLHLKAFVTDFLNAIIKMEVQAEEAKAAQAIIGLIFGSGEDTAASSEVDGAVSAAGSNINWSANAKGGVYDSPSLSAFSGQIVNSPTMFKFASGAGLMGEAGPEAILPLSRGSDGKLGVVAGGGMGGGVTINTTVNVDSSGNSQSQTNADTTNAAAKAFGNQMSAMAKTEISKATQPGGHLWKLGVGKGQ